MWALPRNLLRNFAIVRRTSFARDPNRGGSANWPKLCCLGGKMTVRQNWFCDEVAINIGPRKLGQGHLPEKTAVTGGRRAP
jgi:hypothetical protein